MPQGPEYLFFIQTADHRFWGRDSAGRIAPSVDPYPLQFSPDGWQGMSVKNVRNPRYWGLDRSVSVPLSFVEDGAEIVKYIFITQGPEAPVFLSIAKQELDYEAGVGYQFWHRLIYRGEIDLWTYNHAGAKVTCNLLEDGLPKYLRANDNTAYEFTMDAPGTVLVEMDGIKLRERINYRDLSGFEVALYAPPEGLAEARRSGRPWFSRQEIDTNPQAREALRGREVAWLADPIDALVLHIQGSGRVRMAQPDGTTRVVRLAFAGSNEQPYQSVGRWLLDRGLIRDASWPGIKAWINSTQTSNPRVVQDMLWSNPRYVFFREEVRTAVDADLGPRGAQGVPLTAGRSIAVDKDSIPYGTPVWLASAGPNANLQRLVFAQDTGSAIVGAVRADYFAGTGAEAGDFAGRMKQGLRLWVLWPRSPR